MMHEPVSSISRTVSGVTTGLSQGGQNLAEGGPLVSVAKTQKKVKKTGCAKCRGCLY